MYRVMIVVALGVGLCAGCATSQQKLEKRATVDKARAQSIALATVPNGKIKSSELEEEKGLLVWSFDIATPGSKNITEVQVDARTGKVVSSKIEKPAQEAKKAKTDKKSAK